MHVPQIAKERVGKKHKRVKESKACKIGKKKNPDKILENKMDRQAGIKD